MVNRPKKLWRFLFQIRRLRQLQGKSALIRCFLPLNGSWISFIPTPFAKLPGILDLLAFTRVNEFERDAKRLFDDKKKSFWDFNAPWNWSQLKCFGMIYILTNLSSPWSSAKITWTRSCKFLSGNFDPTVRNDGLNAVSRPGLGCKHGV